MGYSDHTVGISMSILAASLGATIIEKHIRIDLPTKDRQDSLVASGIDNFTRMCITIRKIDQALSSSDYGVRRITEGEKKTAEWLSRREKEHLTQGEE